MKPRPNLQRWLLHVHQRLLNVTLGAAVEFKSSDLSVEAVLSEEGHQVGTRRSVSETNSTALH